MVQVRSQLGHLFEPFAASSQRNKQDTEKEGNKCRQIALNLLIALKLTKFYSTFQAIATADDQNLQKRVLSVGCKVR